MVLPLITSIILGLSSFVLPATAQRNLVCFPLNGSGLSSEDEIEATEISHALLQNCEDSKVVDVSHQRIRNIQNGTFQGLTKLEKLYLNHNKLELLKSETFCGAPNLTEIDLKGNKLYGIRARTFECLHKLEILLLDRNDIEYFSNDSLADLVNLKILKLSFNQLTDRSFSLEFFKHLRSLTSLDLSNNLLTVISETFFQDLKNLEKVYLSGNKLTSLNMLYWTNNLQKIAIGDNLQLDWIAIRPEQLQLKDLNDVRTLYHECHCTSQTDVYFILVKNKGQPPNCEAQCETSLTPNKYSSQNTQENECSSSISYNGWSGSRTLYTAVVTYVSYIMVADNCNG
ncbi:Leucine-rich repeat transmembrane neuronal protein 2 [Holothuria leucospilota]|uniref:Leucine-rich repeat transmembrane neuronal protein 2 n=1 Tax=Holothuria leucospilota TaxID=206669 RepID=A0A9Q0YHJ2_HOLLE|nr:Leucine-rich repeat transmembrane neuronal protein 2 [Holothuria leucospilota]